MEHTKYSLTLHFAQEIELQRLGSTAREKTQLIPAFAQVVLWPPEGKEKPATLLLMLIAASGQLNLHNNEKADLKLWGTKFRDQPPSMEKEFRIIPAGNFYYILTDRLEEQAKSVIGTDGKRLEDFEVYLADQSDTKFIAKFKLLIAMKAGTMTVHTQHLGVERRDWSN